MAVWSTRVKLVQVREDKNVAIPKIGTLSNVTTHDYKITNFVHSSMLIFNASGYNACSHNLLDKSMRVDTLV